MIIEKIIYDIMPSCIIRMMRKTIQLTTNGALLREIKKYFTNNDLIEQFKSELDYIKRHGTVTTFPYPYIENYDSNVIVVYYDEIEQMSYVIHKGKKLYFPRGMKKRTIRNTYNALLVEQDEASPHMYFKNGFTCEPKDIFLDIGSAEGMLALEVADVVKKIYIFECDSKWIEALQKTFEPWNHKTIIINKCVSNKDTEEHISIDTLLDKNEDNLFIKIDIEGGEKLALLGMERTLKTNKCKIACCTYHKQHDANEFNTFFKKLGYCTEFSNGYMLWIYGKNLEPPYFRKDIIRAKNNII